MFKKIYLLKAFPSKPKGVFVVGSLVRVVAFLSSAAHTRDEREAGCLSINHNEEAKKGFHPHKFWLFLSESKREVSVPSYWFVTSGNERGSHRYSFLVCRVCTSVAYRVLISSEPSSYGTQIDEKHAFDWSKPFVIVTNFTCTQMSQDCATLACRFTKFGLLIGKV